MARNFFYRNTFIKMEMQMLAGGSMRQEGYWPKRALGVVFALGLTTAAIAQEKPMSDAQIEANVLEVTSGSGGTERSSHWLLDGLWHK